MHSLFLYLTGKISAVQTFADNDIRAHNPRFTPEAIRANQAVVDLLERIGAQHEATPAQSGLPLSRLDGAYAARSGDYRGHGVCVGGLDVFMTRTYSTAQASVAAPFEYASLPINILWGLAIWREIPTLTTLAGAALTLLSGLYIFYWEQQLQTRVPDQ